MFLSPVCVLSLPLSLFLTSLFSFFVSVSLSLTCLPLRAVLVCAWAEKGADALGPDGLIVHSDAFPPETLVDTLGAGDTFNAAVIYTLSNGETLDSSNVYLVVFILSTCPTELSNLGLNKELSIAETSYCPTMRLYNRPAVPLGFHIQGVCLSMKCLFKTG